MGQTIPEVGILNERLKSNHHNIIINNRNGGYMECFRNLDRRVWLWKKNSYIRHLRKTYTCLMRILLRENRFPPTAESWINPSQIRRDRRLTMFALEMLLQGVHARHFFGAIHAHVLVRSFRRGRTFWASGVRRQLFSEMMRCRVILRVPEKKIKLYI